MVDARSQQMEQAIARCRLVLSAVALSAVYLDPAPPALLPHVGGGRFAIDPLALAVFGAHLGYSVGALWMLGRGIGAWRMVAAVTTWADVVFATLIMLVTEGVSSPFLVFFVLATIAPGLRWGHRRAVPVIVVSILLYLSLILVSSGDASAYVMRPVYLATIGYLIAWLGQRRLDLESAVYDLQAETERNRLACTLHDGCLQTLAGVGLRIEGARLMFEHGRTTAATVELSKLRSELRREHDALRTYVQELARRGPRSAVGASQCDTRVRLAIDFAGSQDRVEDLLGLVREALANVRRHARADAASVVVRTEGGRLVVTIDDDGTGFADDAEAPWSIAARVAAAGGALEVQRARPGAHLRITMPMRGVA